MGLQGKRWKRPIEIDRNRSIDFDHILTVAATARPPTTPIRKKLREDVDMLASNKSA